MSDSGSDSARELDLWTDPITSWHRDVVREVWRLESLRCTPEQINAIFDILVIATITLDLELKEYDDWIQEGLVADAKRLQRRQRVLGMVPGYADTKKLVEVELACTSFLEKLYPDFKRCLREDRYGFLSFFERTFRLPYRTKHTVLAAKREQIAANPIPWAW
ncbi:hypothetical protein BKA56DRAFT_678041 [Ilyonectria sp. MPI-CAGE-AT-0026]|nr:hypothetical protein BKA56DRAFT_678041 [Ilyonectria sp. MPI-CAGE-AT-0026]